MGTSLSGDESGGFFESGSIAVGRHRPPQRLQPLVAAVDKLARLLDPTLLDHLVPLAFLFGGFGLPIYSLCVAHANDLTPTARAVSVAGGLLGLYGLSASIGPFVAGLLMDLIGPRGLFLYTGALLLALLGFALHRPNRTFPPMTKASIAPLIPAEFDGDQGRPRESVFD